MWFEIPYGWYMGVCVSNKTLGMLEGDGMCDVYRGRVGGMWIIARRRFVGTKFGELIDVIIS